MRKMRGVLVAAGAAAVLLATGATAEAMTASGPVNSGVVNACYKTAAAANGSHAVVLEDQGTACPSGYTSLTWNQKGPQGPSGVTSVTQYSPDGAAPVTGGWGFLGAPPQESFKGPDTAAQVTATVDEASADGNEIFDYIGVCYERVGASTVTSVSEVAPEFAADADSFFAQTVSGVVGGLASGEYYVGLCAQEQSDVLNGLATATITMAQTASGVIYAGPETPAAGSAAGSSGLSRADLT